MALNREKSIPWPPVLPYDKQSVQVPGTKRPGQTALAIFGLLTEETPNSLLTVDEIFLTGLKVGRDRAFLGHRQVISKNPLRFAAEYTWQTYGEVDERRRCIGSALHALFTRGEVGGGDYDTVGIWSQNRPEWQIVDLALQSYQKVEVSLYDTLGQDSVGNINHAHITVVFSTCDHLPALLKLSDKIPQVKLLVSMDELTPEMKNVGIKVMDLLELETFGKANLIDPIPATPDLVSSICYTSVRAVLKHKNLALAVQSNLYGLSLPDNGSMLSYLPLAHIYGRLLELCTMAVGAKIGYFTGDPLRLLEDAQILKPQFFPSVPRVLNRRRWRSCSRTGDPTHVFWDKLVFRKLSSEIQISLLTSGSAPISPDVLDFLKIAFACEVVEGIYGMTETSLPFDPTCSGTVGPPQPVNEVKLVDVPSMGYTSEDKPNPRGELCIRGVNCFTEYYKGDMLTLPQTRRTHENTLDNEGWLHTGDVAEIDSCGRVKIIDRIKNIMKLAQGEYVALERVENLYSSVPIVSQIYVHGDSLQSYLVAIVVLDPVQLAILASKVFRKKVAQDNQQELFRAISDQSIQDQILSILSREARRNGLKGFETVKRIHLTLEAFSVENGTLTPTMKIKRKDAYKMHKAAIENLYRMGEPIN
ncbi:long-chain-fatty-acid-CoA ligase [Amanita rubescens]|nr:long-chain-fatty-acid-CoA ligase [Amanita rubescens]